MIDYVMPITKENLESLRDMGFILSRLINLGLNIESIRESIKEIM